MDIKKLFGRQSLTRGKFIDLSDPQNYIGKFAVTLPSSFDVYPLGCAVILITDVNDDEMEGVIINKLVNPQLSIKEFLLPLGSANISDPRFDKPLLCGGLFDPNPGALSSLTRIIFSLNEWNNSTLPCIDMAGPYGIVKDTNFVAALVDQYGPRNFLFAQGITKVGRETFDVNISSGKILICPEADFDDVFHVKDRESLWSTFVRYCGLEPTILLANTGSPAAQQKHFC